MTIGPAPICMDCIHYDRKNTSGLTCSAFPNGIPEDIIFSRVDHHKPYDGDHGIQFEGKS